MGSNRTPVSTMCVEDHGGSNRTPVSAMCTIEEVHEVQPNTCVVGSTRTPMSAIYTVEEVGCNTCFSYVYCRGALMGSN